MGSHEQFSVIRVGDGAKRPMPVEEHGILASWRLGVLAPWRLGVFAFWRIGVLAFQFLSACWVISAFWRNFQPAVLAPGRPPFAVPGSRPERRSP